MFSKYINSFTVLLLLLIPCIFGQSIPADQIDEKCRNHEIPCVGMVFATSGDILQAVSGLRGYSGNSVSGLMALDPDASVEFGCDPQNGKAITTHIINFRSGAGHLAGNPNSPKLGWKWFITSTNEPTGNLDQAANAYLMVSCYK